MIDRENGIRDVRQIEIEIYHDSLVTDLAHRGCEFRTSGIVDFADYSCWCTEIGNVLIKSENVIISNEICRGYL